MIALQAGAMILQAPTNIGAASRAEMLEVMYHPGAMPRESEIFTHIQESKKRSLRLLASVLEGLLRRYFEASLAFSVIQHATCLCCFGKSYCEPMQPCSAPLTAPLPSWYSASSAESSTTQGIQSTALEISDPTAVWFLPIHCTTLLTETG